MMMASNFTHKGTTWGNNRYQCRSGAHYPTAITARTRGSSHTAFGRPLPSLPLSGLARIAALVGDRSPWVAWAGMAA